MKIVSAQEMRALDRAASEQHHIASLTLMERAGEGVALAVARCVSRSAGPIGILVGKGNNGGDGLVAARFLIERGYAVMVFPVVPPAQLSADAEVNWQRLTPLGPQLCSLTTLAHDGARCSCFIDALIGTGLTESLSNDLQSIIATVQHFGKPIMAVDLPTGLQADTGEVMGAAFVARETIALGLPKRGFFHGAGPEHVGKISVVDIGLPAAAIAKLETTTEMITPSLFAELLAARPRTAHKGMFGHVLVIAGHGGMLGAGYLASLAALRAGAGLVTYALPAAAFEKFDARYPEIMGEALPKDISRALALTMKKNVVALGPAMGTEPQTVSLLQALIEKVPLPLVVDADGLNALANNIDLLRRRTHATILTPHPGEMGRLMKLTTALVQADRMACAKKLAHAQRVIVVLKGAQTVIAFPDGRLFVNPTGNPGMATAGMGDVLAGIIAGCVARARDPGVAALAGVYLHGLAGDLAVQRGETGTIASDLLAALPAAIEQARAEVSS